MASLNNHVPVSIAVDSVGPQAPGFGLLAFLTYNTSGWGTNEYLRTYSSLSEVAADFPSTSGPEYLAAQQAFAVSPAPESIAFIKGATPPTQRFRLTPVVRNSHVYEITLKGDGVTSETVEYTSDSSATAQEIVEGLTTAVNAVVGKNFTATEDNSVLTITGNAAGEWFAVELETPDDFALVQDHADPGVAADLTAILTHDSSFYGLVTFYNSDAYAKAVAAWANSNARLYWCDSCDNEAITAASDGTTGTLDDLKTLAYRYVGTLWHNALSEMPAAQHLAAFFAFDPGQINAKFIESVGVTPPTLTTTQRTNLVNRRANFVETLAGTSVYVEGKVLSTTFLFVDAVRDLDYAISKVQTNLATILIGTPKLPYTAAGIAHAGASVEGSCRELVNEGVFSDNPAPVVTTPKISAVATADKTARILRNVKFRATLAGAINEIDVDGTVSF